MALSRSTLVLRVSRTNKGIHFRSPQLGNESALVRGKQLNDPKWNPLRAYASFRPRSSNTRSVLNKTDFPQLTWFSRSFSTQSAEVKEAQELLEKGFENLKNGEEVEQSEKDIERAILLLRLAGEQKLEMEALESLANTLLNQPGRRKYAAVTLEKLLEVAQDAQDLDYELRAYYRLGNLRLQQGHEDTNRIFKDGAARAVKAGRLDLASSMYANLGLSFSKEGISDAAIKYFIEALHSAQSAKDSPSEINATMLIAREFTRSGEYSEANDYWSSLLTLSRNANNATTEWMALDEMGKNFLQTNQHEDALAVHERALALAKKQRNVNQQLSSLQNISTCYRLLGEEDKVKKCSEEMTEINAKRPQGIGVLKGRLLQGRTAAQAKDYPEAERLFREALQHARRDNDKVVEANALTLLGSIFEVNGRNDEAVEVFEDALVLARELDIIELERLALTSLGSIHARAKHYEEAVKFLHKALVLCEQVKDEMSILGIYAKMAQSYRALGKNSEANFFLASTIALTKKLSERGVLKDIPEEIHKVKM